MIINGSFEEANTEKLKKLGKLALANGWTTATEEKVDLFSKFASYPEVGAPKNSLGTSNPKDGNNYVGIATHRVASKDGRGYITSSLDGYLEKDKKYCLRYSISLADAARYATNNLGFHFSKKPIYEEDKEFLIKDETIYPQNNKVMKNADSWEDVCVWFNAEGYEKYVTIGNFSSTTRTVAEKVSKPKGFEGTQIQAGYYFLDDISLVQIDRPSECTCKDNSEPEGPRIIFSKTAALNDKASAADKVKASTVYFYSNEDELVSATTKELDKLVTLMESNANLKLIISGHMDSKEVDKGNQYDTFKDLSASRAEAIKQYMVDKGVSSSRLRTESHKADEPATQMKTPLSLARNRRVEFKLQ